MRVLLVAGSLLAAPVAHAEDVVVHTFAPAPVLQHPVLEVRIGADSGAVGPGETFQHPTICAEVEPLDRLSFEGCGNGAGFLHQDDTSDMAHFRMRYAPVRVRRGRIEAAGLAGAGFAEVQRPGDTAGFQFGQAAPGAVDAAGAELSVGGKAHYWFDSRAYFSLDLTVGGAWIPGATEVLGQPDPLVPFGALTMGVGF